MHGLRSQNPQLLPPLDRDPPFSRPPVASDSPSTMETGEPSTPPSDDQMSMAEFGNALTQRFEAMLKHQQEYYEQRERNRDRERGKDKETE